ncbi:MAG: GspH/FimT family pseudopilin [Pseudomonadota bacterium]
MGRSSQSHGFTLIELMITVAIVGIFVAVAVPSFINFVSNNRTESASNELLSFMQYARSTAVQNKASLTACLEAEVWTLKKDCDDADTTSLRTLENPPNIDVLANAEEVTFRSNGTASTAVSIIACREDDFRNAITLTVQNSGSTRTWPRGKTENNASYMSTCTP